MNKRIVSLLLVTLLVFSSFTASAEGVSVDVNDVEIEENIDLDLINSILDFIETQYKYDISREELIQGAYKGITDVLDKHSKYFTEEEYTDFIDSLDGSLIGIGVYVDTDVMGIKVISPIEGTPADIVGVQAGDIITHVNGLDITKYSFEDGIDMIKGVAGTEVKITVYRNGSVIEFSIIRELIKIKDVEYELLEGNIGYVRIKQFGSNVANEFSDAVIDLKNQGMSSIIVDLRNNPGGYLGEVIEVADWFVDVNDPIVHIDYKTRTDEDYYGKVAPLDIPTAVLINGGSASASEILAGAIKNNDVGEIIGTLSYGKGTVQNLLQLTGGAGLKLTTAEYLSAGKIPVNEVGVTPDVVIELATNETLSEVNHFVPMNEVILAKLGNVGLNTFGLQQRLKFLGYDVDVDGKFGNQTKAALGSFQTNRNIKLTYSIGIVTINELELAITEFLETDLQLEEAKKFVNEK